jgi:sulfite reductase alpha subunit-like flavoprotein
VATSAPPVVRILYGSQTGTAQFFAEQLRDDLLGEGMPVEAVDQRKYDPVRGGRCGPRSVARPSPPRPPAFP